MRSRTAIGWLIGVLTAFVAVGVGETVAVLVRPVAAPLIAVGNRIIVLTPESWKRPAIGKVGTNDKTYLIVGICVVLALVAALIGTLALRSLVAGLVGVALIGAFAVYCAATAPASRASDVLPSLIGTAVAMAVLAGLVRLAHPGEAAGDRPAPALADRRVFLAGSGAAAVLAALAGFGGRAAQHARFDVAAKRRKLALPAASAQSSAVPAGVDLGKSGVPWRTSNADFYRIDTALSVPQIDPDSWKLRIHGLVDTPMTLSFKELLARPLEEHWVTLNCVSNEVGGDLVSNALFRGVRLDALLREAGLRSGADQLLMTSEDGMTIGAPARTVMDGRAALLAVGMNGKALPVEHGFPVRVVVPGLYGYISACKWVVDLEATTFAKHKAYWVEGGWAQDAPIRMASRIDRPSSNEVLNVGEPFAVAGVAWEQHVGIGKVEVQINNGPWATARLAAVPSEDTWRQWVYAWTPQESGQYTIRVRATDTLGRVQDAKVRDVFPSGATGLHTASIRAVI
ncbi:molybdopterin-dependent oxidoreductase [uncultured Jatrophihabitans sp.]|uniref:molybdopterin-dependent oxidoreductase n=1 Tax=uncultured Jatrophihabitans sp. TaxID=1610747 RepID=UPI0035CB0AD1